MLEFPRSENKQRKKGSQLHNYIKEYEEGIPLWEVVEYHKEYSGLGETGPLDRGKVLIIFI